MHPIEKLAWIVLAAVIGLGLAALVAGLRQQFLACPQVPANEVNYKEVVAALTDVVKWGLGVSVGATGLFGSQLLLLKDSPRYTQTGRLLVVSVVLSMCLATFFGLRWQTLVGQSWFLNCPHLIGDVYLQRSFDFHTYFLAGGLGILALMAILLTFSKNKGEV
jgi:hypothetical protein